MAAFEERVARNEALFREVNERVQDLAARFSTPSTQPAGFVCECSDDECVERIDVPLAVYGEVRGNGRRFVVLPGHVLEQIEHVVEATPTYVIVEKDTPTSIRVVERHDPRA
jgi:hypothetical protein